VDPRRLVRVMVITTSVGVGKPTAWALVARVASPTLQTGTELAGNGVVLLVADGEEAVGVAWSDEAEPQAATIVPTAR